MVKAIGDTVESEEKIVKAIGVPVEAEIEIEGKKHIIKIKSLKKSEQDKIDKEAKEVDKNLSDDDNKLIKKYNQTVDMLETYECEGEGKGECLTPEERKEKRELLKKKQSMEDKVDKIRRNQDKLLDGFHKRILEKLILSENRDEVISEIEDNIGCHAGLYWILDIYKEATKKQ